MHNNFVRKKREKNLGFELTTLVSEVYNVNHYAIATHLLNVKIKSYIKVFVFFLQRQLPKNKCFLNFFYWNSLGERANCESFDLYLSKKTLS